jgi:hypothetical protein
MEEISDLINKYKHPYPQNRIEISTCLAAILHAINGVSWSISLSDWQYLERSGAIVVVIGILLAWRDLTGKIEVSKNYVNSRFYSKITELQNNTSGIVNREIQTGEQIKLDKSKTEVQNLFDIIINRIRTIEAIVLIAGTLIWSYGSIVAKHIHNFA